MADVRAATPTQSIEIAIPVRADIDAMLENKKRYLYTLMKGKLDRSRKELENLQSAYALKSFSRKIDDYKNEVVLREKELQRAMKIFLERKRQGLELKTEKIINLNPLATLSRGYSITKKDDEILKDTISLKVGDEITTNLYKGNIVSIVKEINE